MFKNPILKAAARALATILGSELAQKYAPSDVDVRGLPVRKFGGGFLAYLLAAKLTSSRSNASAVAVAAAG